MKKISIKESKMMGLIKSYFVRSEEMKISKLQKKVALLEAEVKHKDEIIALSNEYNLELSTLIAYFRNTGNAVQSQTIPNQVVTQQQQFNQQQFNQQQFNQQQQRTPERASFDESGF